MSEKQLTGYPSIDKPWLKYYTEEAINAKLPECTIYEYLWESNKEKLDDVALIYFGRKFTYRNLFENIDIVANAFASIGVSKGDIVTIALPNIPENIYCIYALNKLGAVADMVDLRSKGSVLLHYLTQTKSKTAVICDLFAENTFELLAQTNLERIIVASPFDSLAQPLRTIMKLKNSKLSLPQNALTWKEFSLKQEQTAECNKGENNDTACIFHTSGTTGLPKGVMLTNQNFNAMAQHCKSSGLKFYSGDKMMNQVPPFLAYNALCATHMPLVTHMQIIMLPEYRPDKFAQNIMKLKPNCAIAGPADWNNFLENEKLSKHPFDFSFLKSMISGSDSLSQKSKDDINSLMDKNGCQEKVLEGYGMTEIGSAACVNLPQCNVDNSVGIPLPLNNFCIYDNESQTELPYGTVGEICMTGPTVMKGYFNNTEETDNMLKKHTDGLYWLHSGDIGYIDENGVVYLQGRLKRIIVRHDGIKVSPFSLEDTIMKHKNVSACCVVGGFDSEHNMGQVPIAYIVLKEADDSSVAEIKELVKAEQSEKYLPFDYIVLTALPLTPNGKVDYRTLEKQYAETH